jgi:hypothetical protein
LALVTKKAVLRRGLASSEDRSKTRGTENPSLGSNNVAKTIAAVLMTVKVFIFDLAIFFWGGKLKACYFRSIFFSSACWWRGWLMVDG